MIISADVDEVLNDLVRVILEQYNADSGDNLTIGKITDYRIANFTIAGYDITKYFNSKYTREHLAWDVEWVANIIDNNLFDIYFTTSTYPKDCEWKIKALTNAISAFSSKSDEFINNYVLSHFIRMENKQLVRADIVIDDCIDNLQLWNDKVYNILLSKPWNTRLAHQYNVQHRQNSILICDNTDDIYTCLDAIKNGKGK